jgi:hypothetical protein
MKWYSMFKKDFGVETNEAHGPMRNLEDLQYRNHMGLQKEMGGGGGGGFQGFLVC